MADAPRTELAEFVEWLVDYAAQELDPVLVEKAVQRDLPTRTMLELGHSAALLAVSKKVKQLLRRRKDNG